MQLQEANKECGRASVIWLRISGSERSNMQQKKWEVGNEQRRRTTEGRSQTVKSLDLKTGDAYLIDNKALFKSIRL